MPDLDAAVRAYGAILDETLIHGTTPEREAALSRAHHEVLISPTRTFSGFSTSWPSFRPPRPPRLRALATVNNGTYEFPVRPGPPRAGAQSREDREHADLPHVV